ncbi:MAG: hypothetical protein IJP52_04675 [Paludibacteraceae bacterium]|nr:hypothetical protein [Paludibacteraceae bacterium]
MKSILLICVNYKSYDALQAFLASVHEAEKQVQGKMRVEVEVVDNSEHNVGYLGGALPVYNRRAAQFDYVSISNVDLQLAPDFLAQLLMLQSDGVGWWAPDIYTPTQRRHENPYMLKRPTRYNFRIWNLIYSSVLIFKLYYLLHLLKGKTARTYPPMPIYAGHGAFMLLTKAFVQAYPQVHFPSFMYNEEIYLAELARQADLPVRYAPTLRIENIGSVSTGRVRQRQKSAWNKQSLEMIKKMFFV